MSGFANVTQIRRLRCFQRSQTHLYVLDLFCSSHNYGSLVQVLARLSELLSQDGRIRLLRGQKATIYLSLCEPPSSPHSEFVAAAIMAATFDTLHFPPQIAESIRYNGPPKIKRAPRCIRQNALLIPDEWPDIDTILGIVPESKAASERKTPLTPTMSTGESRGVLELSMLRNGF